MRARVLVHDYTRVSRQTFIRRSIISEFTQYRVSIQRQDACQINVITAHAREVCSPNYDIWKLCTLTNVILVCLWNRMLDFRAKLLIVVPTDSITVWPCEQWRRKTQRGSITLVQRSSAGKKVNMEIWKSSGSQSIIAYIHIFYITHLWQTFPYYFELL